MKANQTKDFDLRQALSVVYRDFTQCVKYFLAHPHGNKVEDPAAIAADRL
jgi:hypothetical protein